MGDTSLRQGRSRRHGRLSAEDVRAAVEAHRELGPDYGDAVAESFLSRIEEHVEALVEQRVAAAGPQRRRPEDPARTARLGRPRAFLAGFATAAVVLGVPLTGMALEWPNGHPVILVMWLATLAVCGTAAYCLRRR